MRTEYIRPYGDLSAIRIELRGPIKLSPFAGNKKKPKLDYCDRQIKFYRAQYEQCCSGVLHAQILRWTQTKRQVLAGNL